MKKWATKGEEEEEEDKKERHTKAQIGKGVVLPLPPPTAKVHTKIMTEVPPSSAAESKKL
jgi:hypothetical protein